MNSTTRINANSSNSFRASLRADQDTASRMSAKLTYAQALMLDETAKIAAIEAANKLAAIRVTRRADTPDEEALINAVKGNKIALVKTLLANGVCPNVYDHTGVNPRHWPPLKWAIEYGYEGVVEALVTHPSTDVNGRAWETKTTNLMCAVVYGNINIVRMLLEHGADVQQCCEDDQSMNVLHFAAGYADYGKTEILELLCQQPRIEPCFTQKWKGMTPWGLAWLNRLNFASSRVLAKYGGEVR